MSFGYWWCKKCKDYTKIQEYFSGPRCDETNCGHDVDEDIDYTKGFDTDDQYEDYLASTGGRSR